MRRHHPARGWRGPVRRRLLALAALLLAAGAGAQEAAPAGAAPAPFRMAGGITTARTQKAFGLIYEELFRRLEVPAEISFYSLARRTALVTTGGIDGEMARVRAYGDAHPELVRVEESIVDFAFALFSAQPGLRLGRLEELRDRPYRVEYRRGILMCETALKQLVPPERLSDVPTTEQGVRKLVAGRSDLYCELDFQYVEEVLESPDLRGAPSVHRVLRFATLPTYPYLHRRHAALAPRMAEVLRRMKAEGRIEKHLRDAGIDPALQP